MKGETTYMKTLGKVEAKLSRMKEQAAAARWFYENGNLPESYNRALRLEELSEQTVLLTRVLPAYTGAVGATTQTDAIISDTIPVEVGFTAEGWFSIRIPTLLPKKASGSADYTGMRRTILSGRYAWPIARQLRSVDGQRRRFR